MGDLGAAYADCDRLVATADRDRWLAALLAPAAARPHLHALAAFATEVGRVREVVRSPLPGEIRLQWWVDALSGGGHGDVSAHPVAAALLDTIDRYGLSREALADHVEARRFDLYDDAMPTLADLEGYCGETASVLVQAAAVVLSGGRDPGSADAAGHAGVAMAMTGLMRALPIHARRGQVFLPVDVLARHGTDSDAVRAAEATPEIRAALGEMREHVHHHLARTETALAAVDPVARPAFAGLAFVPGYLKRLDRADPFGPPVDLPAWRKPLALWLWARRPAPGPGAVRR